MVPEKTGRAGRGRAAAHRGRLTAFARRLAAAMLCAGALGTLSTAAWAQAPVLESATVASNGLSVDVVMDESIIFATFLRADVFKVTADGVPIGIGRLGDITLAPPDNRRAVLLDQLSPAIRRGQTVVVTYTKTDDAGVQDRITNDLVESFITGRDGVPAAINESNVQPVAPGQVLNLAAETIDNTGIALTWDAPADNGGRVITGYRIERSADGMDPWILLVADHDEMSGGEVVRRYDNTGLAPGTARHYRVRATNEVAAGAWSDVAEGSAVKPGAPGAPTGLTATAGKPSPEDGTTLIRLAWTAPSTIGGSAISGYRIDRSANGGVSWAELVANTGTDAVTHTDRGLGSEATRHYRVSAINGDGAGPHSNVANATTADVAPPVLESATVAPDGLSAEVIMDESVDFSDRIHQAGAFKVTADGVPIGISSLGLLMLGSPVGKDAVLLRQLSPAIGQGQTVVVTYTKTDSFGVQDSNNNLMESFITGRDGVVAAINNSELNVNSPATGTVPIRGKHRVGETVRLRTADIRDADGLGIRSRYTYQWFRLDGSTETPIASATATTYTLVPSDAGKLVGARVSFTDSRNNAESLASRAVLIRAATPETCPTFNLTSTGRSLIWSAAVTVAPWRPHGSDIRGYGSVGDTGGISYRDLGIGANEYRVHGAVAEGGYASAPFKFFLNGVLTPAEIAALRLHICGETYNFSDALVGYSWSGRQYSWRGAAIDWSAVATRTVRLTVPGRPAEGKPAISGTAAVGGMLTAARGNIVDLDGPTDPVFAWQWVRVDADGRSNRRSIPGATAIAYSPTKDDVGKRLRVKATFTDNSGNFEARISDVHPDTVPQPPEIRLSKPALSMPLGGSSSYTIRLAAAPTGTVAMTVGTAGNNDVSVSPTILTFTTGDWRPARTVTVTSRRDASPNTARATVTHSVSPGGGYDNVAVPDIPVEVYDKSGAGTHGAVRLGGASGVPGLGRVEVADYGQWGTVCDDRQNLANLTPVLACRMAGYAGGRRALNRNTADFNANSDMPVVYSAVICRAGEHGDATRLQDCENLRNWGNQCSHSEDLWVQCSGTLSGSAALSNMPRLSVSDVGGKEGPYDGPDTLTFTVVLQPAAYEPVTVDYATRDLPDTETGRAIAGEDYTATSGTLTFAAGETSKTVEVDFADDDIEDNYEIFHLVLSRASFGALIGDGVGEGLIFNDDPPAAAFVDPPAYHGGEAFTVELAFTETVDADVEKLRGGLTATGGAVTGVAPTEGSEGGRSWQISVRPAGAQAPVVLTLAAVADCSASGAICGADGRAMEENAQVTVAAAATAPVVTGMAITPDEPDRQSWIANETFALHVTFSEPVTVAAGRTKPFIEVTARGESAIVGYDSGSGSDTLVFSTVALAASRDFTEVAVVADSLAANGVAIVSAASGIAADLGHDATEPTEPPAAEAQDAVTAVFAGAPESHGGDAFTLELAFGEDLAGFSYRTLQGDGEQQSALSVTGGRVHKARRLVPGKNRRWQIEIVPVAGAGDVTVSLPATADCAAPRAVCTGDGRTVSAAAPVTVPRDTAQPFAVHLKGMPATHDGSTAIVFEVAFDKEPEPYSYTTLRDSTLAISQGGTALTPKVRRLNAPNNDRWEVTVEPGGNEDLSVAIAPTADCGEAGAVCTDGTPREMLSVGAAATVLGPPGLSVADARADENTGDPVDFTVTLGRASGETVTVDYATADGTAVAGEDYTETSGTLTFAPGDTVHTVSVPVLPDGHDEGEETFTLTLSNPQGGAWLKDATATGVIENTDPMPQAWLARFGRTVADQVLEAVEGRFATAPTRGAVASLAGEAVGGAPADGIEEERQLKALSDWLTGETNETRSRALGGRDLLTGTSFALTGGTADSGLVSLWGRGAVSRFDGRDGDLTLDGEVASAMLGADWTRGVWTAGLLLSRSEGEGGYRGQGEGRVENTLTGFFPYGRFAANDRVTLWGAAGYGEGTLTLTPKKPGTDEDGRPIEAGMDLLMSAVGIRGVVAKAGAQGGPEMAMKSDAMAVRTSSETVAGLASAKADVTRVRIGLEGTWRGIEAGGGALAPRVELALRHDGGDAETGFGVDLGGGVSWSHPASGVAATFRGRALLTHEAGGFRDRGLSGSLAWDPRGGSGRGPQLTLTQTLGAPDSGDALAGLPANDLEPGSGASGNGLANRSLDLRLGYGFGVLGNRFTATPEAGIGLSNSHREYRLGWRLGLDRHGPLSLELDLSGTRREAVNDDAPPPHAVELRGSLRW